MFYFSQDYFILGETNKKQKNDKDRQIVEKSRVRSTNVAGPRKADELTVNIS